MRNLFLSKISKVEVVLAQGFLKMMSLKPISLKIQNSLEAIAMNICACIMHSFQTKNNCYITYLFFQAFSLVHIAQSFLLLTSTLCAPPRSDGGRFCRSTCFRWLLSWQRWHPLTLDWCNAHSLYLVHSPYSNLLFSTCKRWLRSSSAIVKGVMQVFIQFGYKFEDFK